MRYTAAYLLAILGGNPSPDVAAIAKILGSVGIECDENRAQQVVNACKGQDVNELIASGMVKIDDALKNTSVGTTPPKGKGEPPVIVNPPSPPPRGGPGSPPLSPTGSVSFVSSFFPLTVLIFIRMFLLISNRWTYSINMKSSNLGKNQSKQDLQLIILSFFSVLQ
jgi:large subunit ribosomal protein LP2